MLKTFDVPPCEGRVCIVTGEPGRSAPTVECYHRNLAFRFEDTSSKMLQVGEWIRFNGRVRVDPGVERNGDLVEKVGYYHDPFDGSERATWMFFQLRDPEYVRIWPPNVMGTMRGAWTEVGRFLEKPDRYYGLEEMRRMKAALESAADLLGEKIREEALEGDPKVIQTPDPTV